MRYPSERQLRHLISEADSSQTLRWNGNDDLELHGVVRRLSTKISVGWGGKMRAENIGVNLDGVTLVLPTDPDHALRSYRSFRRLAQRTLPSLLSGLRTIIMCEQAHPSVPEVDAIANARRRWVCFYNLARQSACQFVFDHELAHIFSRHTRLEMGMEQHSVLADWRTACRLDQIRHFDLGFSETSLPWVMARDRKGTRLTKRVLLGCSFATDHAFDQNNDYHCHEEDFCDAIGLQLASVRGRGLGFHDRNGAQRFTFEQLFPHRAAVIGSLLADFTETKQPLLAAA